MIKKRQKEKYWFKRFFTKKDKKQTYLQKKIRDQKLTKKIFTESIKDLKKGF